MQVPALIHVLHPNRVRRGDLVRGLSGFQRERAEVEVARGFQREAQGVAAQVERQREPARLVVAGEPHVGEGQAPQFLQLVRQAGGGLDGHRQARRARIRPSTGSSPLKGDRPWASTASRISKLCPRSSASSAA